MKVYTKTGDKGKTSLIGGTRVAKNDVRLEAYGTVDELNSHIGLLRSYVQEDNLEEILIDIQNQLFKIGSHLAVDISVSEMRPEFKLDDVRIELLEEEMDRLEDSLSPLTGFILPGGHQATAVCHIARTVCRRAERRVIDIRDVHEIDSWIVRYLNRLSDFLFVLSRHLTNYFGADEIQWDSKL